MAAGAQSVDFGSAHRRKFVFFRPLIGDKLFQDIRRRVANFLENRPRNVERSVDGKNNIAYDQNVSWSNARA